MEPRASKGFGSQDLSCTGSLSTLSLVLFQFYRFLPSKTAKNSVLPWFETSLAGQTCISIVCVHAKGFAFHKTAFGSSQEIRTKLNELYHDFMNISQRVS